MNSNQITPESIAELYVLGAKTKSVLRPKTRNVRLIKERIFSTGADDVPWSNREELES
jgi:hypothetical protein